MKEGVLNVRVYHGKNRGEMLPDVRDGGVDILLVSYHTLGAEFGNVFGKDDGVANGEEPRRKRSRRTSIFDITFHRIVLDEAVSYEDKPKSIVDLRYILC